jgi:hypothetical protein
VTLTSALLMTLPEGSLTTPEMLPPTEAQAIAVEIATRKQTALMIVRTILLAGLCMFLSDLFSIFG